MPLPGRTEPVMQRPSAIRDQDTRFMCKTCDREYPSARTLIAHINEVRAATPHLGLMENEQPQAPKAGLRVIVCDAL